MAINGWVAFNKPEHTYYVFACIILTLPLLFLAVNSLLVKPAQPRKDPDQNFDIMAESLAPYITALVAATVFMIFVYKTVSGGEHAALFFVAPRIAGWQWQEGALTGMMCLLMGACGAGIWSAAFRQRHIPTGSLRRTASYRIMLLNLSPGVRLAFYYVILCCASLAGYAVVYRLFGAGRSHDWPGYIIVAGRSLLPVTLLLPAALLRLPMLPLGILILGAVGYLFGYNTAFIEGGFFAGTQGVVLAALAATLHFRGAKGRAPEPMSEHNEACEDSGIHEEITGSDAP